MSMNSKLPKKVYVLDFYSERNEDVIPEPIKKGKFILIKELNTTVFIRKGNTIKKWLLNYRTKGCISKSKWMIIHKKYFSRKRKISNN